MNNNHELISFSTTRYLLPNKKKVVRVAGIFSFSFCPPPLFLSFHYHNLSWTRSRDISNFLCWEFHEVMSRTHHFFAANFFTVFGFWLFLTLPHMPLLLFSNLVSPTSIRWFIQPTVDLQFVGFSVLVCVFSFWWVHGEPNNLYSVLIW